MTTMFVEQHLALPRSANNYVCRQEEEVGRAWSEPEHYGGDSSGLTAHGQEAGGEDPEDEGVEGPVEAGGS